MPVRNLKPHSIFLFAVHFHQIGIRNIHFLGTASFPNIAVMAYLARHMFDWVSFDATNWLQEAISHSYFDPNNLAAVEVGYKFDATAALPMECECPWCHLETFESIHAMPDKERRDLLYSHNFWATDQVAERLYDKAIDAYTLMSHIDKVSRKGTPPRKGSQREKGIRTLCRLLSQVECYRELYPTELYRLEKELQSFRS